MTRAGQLESNVISPALVPKDIEFVISDVWLAEELGEAWQSLDSSEQRQLRVLWEQAVRDAVQDFVK